MWSFFLYLSYVEIIRIKELVPRLSQYEIWKSFYAQVIAVHIIYSEESDKWPSLEPLNITSSLLEHCTGIAEVIS